MTNAAAVKSRKHCCTSTEDAFRFRRDIERFVRCGSQSVVVVARSHPYLVGLVRDLEEHKKVKSRPINPLNRKMTTWMSAWHCAFLNTMKSSRAVPMLHLLSFCCHAHCLKFPKSRCQNPILHVYTFWIDCDRLSASCFKLLSRKNNLQKHTNICAGHYSSTWQPAQSDLFSYFFISVYLLPILHPKWFHVSFTKIWS